MPELPEMETYRNLLNQKVAGQVITDVQINREKSINLKPELFRKTILHQKVITVNRRGKHLLFQLQNSHVLLLHLMLGGWMFYGTEVEKPKRTIQVRLSFGQQHLYFIGLRLGYLHLNSQNETEKKLSDLGPEPLEITFTLSEFLKRMAAKHGKLKTTMLNQEFIAGIGNCYSAEICYHAGILPTNDIDDISESERSQLFHSIRVVLQDAIKNGGYMDQPLYKEDSLTGGYNKLCKVYNREGENCYRCGTNIVMKMISSRKTFYCPNCQK
ncbi:bifunctional DNA-formamidopyrimidine glycosylase/DNA-(apurinic or apyrimidinic site) lyase [Neobacillus sp. MM2021_6]|uniref:bifunctional DNA-formamidopyrimidine glycosylase/DNA-(apurinic or apyrimidinic site) lyase n=1 Tax=Bacillaceae TaxID=186817 RepID=UPI00140C0775|nr:MULTISPECIES: bifunctional DNA-formamidopyrimidine glycosylase/DNA-(apurinic or apyrimidinic site) lyase [Bacillaceae]MBO0962227.1 bifunctional DNA-formamidopyrimidine glycosylase/DNA-(apurinic or apyrimidinic site) lyase [Neobacillus sp. MM2021_6]NHC18240.1 bifunctional DNA-formamidopyrimidine glycosylase/DNA-(apurinic or apyrimidinic site) lyase [Bacillus sp. MM2020_4]